MSFHDFATKLQARFLELAATGELFVMTGKRTDEDEDIDAWRAEQKNALWRHYLGSFPEGSNPVYIKNSEHDCACCRQVIKNIGNVVAVVDETTKTVWDIYSELESPYREVAYSMFQFVGAELRLNGVFRVSDQNFKFGDSHTLQYIDGKAKKWDHLWAIVPTKFRLPAKDLGTEVNKINTTIQVYQRGLEELSIESVDTVLDLIKEKTLYRGKEFEERLIEFRKDLEVYQKMGDMPRRKARFVHANYRKQHARIRNTAMGTLLQDLTEGKDLEASVDAFGIMMDPANYKRTTALVTPAMIKKALADIEEAGLESALHRRHARLTDVSVSNVLWTDSGLRGALKGSTLSDIMGVSDQDWNTPSRDPESITVDWFVENILPKARSMGLLIEHKHQGNFMSITTSKEEGAPKLFKWDNPFAWSYDGNVTDSIKEKVKRAGGNVNADLRVSLAWHNYDDLDLHCVDPTGRHIYFGAKLNVLDVDMNAGYGKSREPVENMAFMNPRDGDYRFWVHQFRLREVGTDVGFVLELAFGGKVIQMKFDRQVRSNDEIHALMVTVKNGQVVKTQWLKDLVGGGVPVEKWGVTTEQFVSVQTVMLSPNYWDGQAIGNKHWFFLLEGCKNPDPVRGIYNEYLRGDLDKHRKVFEVMGNKMRIEPADEQLSGLGFSSTRQDQVKVQVRTKDGTRFYNIVF